MAILPGTKVGHLTQRLGTILGKTTLFLVAPNYIIAFGLQTVDANSDNVPTFSHFVKNFFLSGIAFLKTYFWLLRVVVSPFKTF